VISGIRELNHYLYSRYSALMENALKILKICIACWGTVVTIAIILVGMLYLLDMIYIIEIYFKIHFTFGSVLLFVIFWPFYSKRIK